MPIALCTTLAKTKGDPIIAIVVVVGIIVLAAVIGIAANVAAKKRRARIASLLADRGYTVAPQPKDPAHAGAFAAAGPFQDLRTGPKGVQWSAHHAGTGVTILEHSYVVSTGKSAHRVVHTIAAVPCPGGWPVLSIQVGGLLGKLADIFGARDVKVEDPAFNKRFRIKGDSDDFSLLVLTPQVQQWFMALPQGYGVRIGAGAMSVFQRRAMKPEELAALGELPLALATLIPPEVASFGA